MEERARLALLNSVRKWNVEEVKKFLEENDLNDFKSFAEAKSLDGFKLLNLSEGIVALWRPKLNIKKFMSIIKDLNENPARYINRKSSIDEERIDRLFEKNVKPKRNSLKSKQSKIKTLEKHPNALKLENMYSANPPIKISRFTVQRVIEDVKIVQIEDTEQSNNHYLDMNVSESVKPTRSHSFKEKPKDDVIDNSDIFRNLQPPKSFLYSQSLETVVRKLNPYETMEPNKTKISATDRGYYEMMRKVRRHSDGSINMLENPYEELEYTSASLQHQKKPTLLERMLRKKDTPEYKPIKSKTLKKNKDKEVKFTQKYKYLPELDLISPSFEIYNDCYSPVKEDDSHIQFAESVLKEALDGVNLDFKDFSENICYESNNRKIVVEDYLEPRVIPPTERGTIMDQVLEEAAMLFYRNNIMPQTKGTQK